MEPESCHGRFFFKDFNVCRLRVMSVSVQNSFAVGDIVEVPATYFDDSDDEAARETPWSVVEFGTAGKSAMCKGKTLPLPFPYS